MYKLKLVPNTMLQHSTHRKGVMGYKSTDGCGFIDWDIIETDIIPTVEQWISFVKDGVKVWNKHLVWNDDREDEYGENEAWISARKIWHQKNRIVIKTHSEL